MGGLVPPIFGIYPFLRSSGIERESQKKLDVLSVSEAKNDYIRRKHNEPDKLVQKAPGVPVYPVRAPDFDRMVRPVDLPAPGSDPPLFVQVESPFQN